MRVAVFLGMLSILLAGAWLGLDHSLDDLLRRELAGYELDGVLAFDDLDVTLPDRVRLRGARLSDPVGGGTVAHVDTLTVQFETTLRDTPDARIAFVRGHGGRARIAWDGAHMVLERAITELVERVATALPGEGRAEPLPRLLFEDMEILVYTSGLPLERFPGSTVTIEETGSEVQVILELGPEGGRVQLVFDPAGLRRVETEGLRTSPAVLALVPEVGEFIGRTLGPSGRADLLAHLPRDGSPEVSGTLRQARLEVPAVPFDLGSATIPFAYQGGLFRVDDARFDFQGGVPTVSVEGTADDFVMTIDLDQAEFREAFLHLVPGYQDVTGVDCDHGGSFELHLTLRFESGEAAPSVAGRGGFHLEKVRFTSFGVELADLVGRFEVDERRLHLPSLSARCASGDLAGYGTVGLLDDRFEFQIQAEDLDVGELYASSGVGEAATGRHISGWLQGEMACSGRLGEIDALSGYGQLSVRAGNLWETPLFEAILMSIQIGESRAASQRLEMAFNILGDKVLVDPIRLQSDMLSIQGAGMADLKGRLNLELVPITVPLGYLGDFLELLQKEFIVKLEVTGRVGSPRVRAVPVDVVTGPLRRVLDFFLGEEQETP